MEGFAPIALDEAGELSGALPRIALCNFVDWVSKHSAGPRLPGDRHGHLEPIGGIRPARVASGSGTFWCVNPNCFLQLREFRGGKPKKYAHL